MCTNHDKIQENPITPETIALLNSFGFVGPKGNQPEFCNVEGVMTAYLKKGRFGIQAQPGAEGGKPYNIYDLSYVPTVQCIQGEAINPRSGYRGPVLRLQVVQLFEEDLPKVPLFCDQLLKAGQAFAS